MIMLLLGRENISLEGERLVSFLPQALGAEVSRQAVLSAVYDYWKSKVSGKTQMWHKQSSGRSGKSCRPAKMENLWQK